MIPPPRDHAAFWVGASTFVISIVPYATVSTIQLVNLPFGVLLTSLLAFGGFGLALALGFGRTRELGLGAVPWRWVAFGAVLGLANLPVTTLVNALVSLATGDEGTKATREVLKLIVGAPGDARFLFVAGAGLCAPLGEEILFRGWLQPLARRALPAWPALVLVGAGFAAIHLQAAAFVALAQLGVLFGLLRLRTGSLWPAIAMHATHNGASLALLFLADDPVAAIDSAPEWGWLVGFGVPAIVAVVLLVRALPPEPPVDDVAPITLRPLRLFLSLSALVALGAGSAAVLALAGPALPGHGMRPLPLHGAYSGDAEGPPGHLE